jgi:hypothetical protein
VPHVLQLDGGILKYFETTGMRRTGTALFRVRRARSAADASLQAGALMAGVLRRVLGVLLILTAVAIPLSREADRSVESLVARWAPAPSDFIEVKGQVVHVRDEGPRDDPEPVVLLHGTSSSLHTWEGWARPARAAPRDQLRPAGLRPHRPLGRASTSPTTTAATPTPASCST